MDQVIGLVDSYAYVPPLVRQVFSHAVFRPPFMGEPARLAEVEAGLAASRQVLHALERIADEGGMVLSGGDVITLADCHLAPMIDYFQRAKEGGAAILSEFPCLFRWWSKSREGGEAFMLSDPPLAKDLTGK